MALVPAGVDRDELYIAARRVLLDALVALGPHREAAVLVGAQAVYLRSQDAQLSVAAFTSDGDLGLDPALLVDDPLIESAMRQADFVVNQPGQWRRETNVGGVDVHIAVDLLVPESLAAPGGTRGARIPPHAKTAARKVRGLEPSVLDHDLMKLASLEPDRDPRSFTINVAGVAALLVAKAFKIAERLAEPGAPRVADKDAGDVVRLMMTSDQSYVAQRLSQLASDQTVGDVVQQGLAELHKLFGGRRTPGTSLAVSALAGAMPETRVRALPPAYMAGLPRISA